MVGEFVEELMIAVGRVDAEIMKTLFGETRRDNIGVESEEERGLDIILVLSEKKEVEAIHDGVELMMQR